jgi:hypothetical protein
MGKVGWLRCATVNVRIYGARPARLILVPSPRALVSSVCGHGKTGGAG